jgi:hypothetical protein
MLRWLFCFLCQPQVNKSGLSNITPAGTTFSIISTKPGAKECCWKQKMSLIKLSIRLRLPKRLSLYKAGNTFLISMHVLHSSLFLLFSDVS